MIPAIAAKPCLGWLKMEKSIENRRTLMVLATLYFAIVLNAPYYRAAMQATAALEPYTQDYLFHTLLRLTGTDTSVYRPERDIFNHCQA